MAGSVATLTYDDFGPVRKIVLDWTSDDTTGAVSATTKKVSGRLIKAITNPGATAPTTLYDIVITDSESFNVLTNTDDDLVDRSATVTEEVYLLVKDHAGTPLAQSVHPVVNDVLTIAITNAGNSKVGALILYLDGEIHG